MRGYIVGNVAEIGVLIGWWLTLVLMFVSVFNLNYAPFRVECNKLMTDTSARTACETAAAGGSVGCVDSFIKNNTWVGVPWWFLYMTPTFLLLLTLPVALYMQMQRYRIMYFVLLIAAVLALAALIVTIVMMAIYWAQCSQHSFCPVTRYYDDFTGYVPYAIAPWFVIYNVTLWAGVGLVGGFLLISLWTQFCLSRAVAELPGHNRADLLNPKFSPEDAAAVRQANIRDGIDFAPGVLESPKWE